ncbi:unnamed protein product [Caenorhabditis brenneri]
MVVEEVDENHKLGRLSDDRWPSVPPREASTHTDYFKGACARSRHEPPLGQWWRSLFVMGPSPCAFRKVCMRIVPL